MEKLKTIEDFLKKIVGIVGNHGEDFVIAYRGECADFGETKLQPSIFRNNSSESVIDAETKMFESIIDYKVSNSENVVEKSIDSQHYISYSRLLDVTFNVMNALFFALSTEIPKNKERNPRVYVFKIPKFLCFSVHSKYLENYFSKIKSECDDIIPSNIKLIMFSLMNERVIAQDGGFILFPGCVCPKIPSVYYETIEISNDETEIAKMLLDLKNLFNISESKIFPERERKAGKIHNEISCRNHYPAEYLDYRVVELILLREKILYELKQFLQKNGRNDSLEKMKKNNQYYFRNLYCKISKDNKNLEDYCGKLEDFEKEVDII